MRRSASVSCGATGKYPPFSRSWYPSPGRCVFQCASAESTSYAARFTSSEYETESKTKNSHSGPKHAVSAMPDRDRCSSASRATRLGSRAYGSRVSGSAISQTNETVGSAAKGSTIAVAGSGMSSMSDSSIPCQPRIDEPSNPRPSANESISSARMGIVTCCHVPSRSQNLRSTIFAFVSSAQLRASSGSGRVPEPAR